MKPTHKVSLQYCAELARQYSQHKETGKEIPDLVGHLESGWSWKVTEGEMQKDYLPCSIDPDTTKWGEGGVGLIVEGYGPVSNVPNECVDTL